MIGDRLEISHIHTRSADRKRRPSAFPFALRWYYAGCDNDRSKVGLTLRKSASILNRKALRALEWKQVLRANFLPRDFFLMFWSGIPKCTRSMDAKRNWHFLRSEENASSSLHP